MGSYTYDMVLKHQAINIHSTDKMFLLFDYFHNIILYSQWTKLENNILEKKNTQMFTGWTINEIGGLNWETFSFI